MCFNDLFEHACFKADLKKVEEAKKVAEEAKTAGKKVGLAKVEEAKKGLAMRKPALSRNLHTPVPLKGKTLMKQKEE